jgi:deoxyadenosine/deoxycytidine kinase
MTITIRVEGNIGSGKTTALEQIRTLCANQVEVRLEPLSEWTDCGGHNALDLQYQHPNQFCFLFQVLAISSMMNRARKSGPKYIIVEERSLKSTNIFIRINYENSHISEVEHAVLQRQMSDALAVTKPRPVIDKEITVYIRTPPEVCLERIKKRGRPEERSIDPKLIYRLHELHEEWLMGKENTAEHSVIVLNGESPDLVDRLRHVINTFSCRHTLPDHAIVNLFP